MMRSREEIVGYVTDNPDLWFYQLVYVSLVLGMVVVGLVKGFAEVFYFMKGAKR